MVPATDVTDVIWPFVRCAATLNYADLCDTLEFSVMSDAVGHDGPLAIRVGTFPFLDPPNQSFALPVNVTWDADARRFEFLDVDVLFHTINLLVRDEDARSLINRCTSRISSTLDVFDVSNAFQLHTIYQQNY